MERIKYRTIFSGWMPIGSMVGDPLLPTESDSSNYEWELISVNTAIGKGYTSSSTYNSNGFNSAGMVFSTTPAEPEQFCIIWTWKGIFRASKMMEKIKLEIM